RREQSETEEMCRLILPLAALYGATREERHLTMLCRVTDDLEAHRHPFGGYCEWDTGYKAACSRESRGECSLLTENGDPVADLLYSVNWLPVGFAYAYHVTGDGRYRDLWRGIAEFMIRTQAISENPVVDGLWCRAFDMELGEVYGCPHDIGWAAHCSESGWTDAEILMGLMLPDLLENRDTFINYAHRGASAYAPENTMRAFRLGVALGANGIETDVRRTKDGVLVLFHDESLLRLTGADRKIAEFTCAELSEIRIPSPDGAVSDTVPKLTELLDFVKEHPVFLALELKEDGLEADLLNAIGASGLKETCVVTSFQWEHLRNIKTIDPTQKVGLLTDTADGGVIRALKAIGAEQICPKASILSPELVRSLHGEGFSVRAWGVRDETMMKAAYDDGADGMTVNFPDKLETYRQGRRNDK
ncbi:MAG: hypothetical protein K6C36_05660, partial [Clostridia bacterium]|nr:hypothetical protein [Clostridia bacterium]